MATRYIAPFAAIRNFSSRVVLVLKNISQVSAANEWNIFQHSKRKFRISVWPCNILYIRYLVLSKMLNKCEITNKVIFSCSFSRNACDLHKTDTDAWLISFVWETQASEANHWWLWTKELINQELVSIAAILHHKNLQLVGFACHTCTHTVHNWCRASGHLKHVHVWRPCLLKNGVEV